MRNLFCLFGTLFLAFLFTDASAQKISDYKWLEGRYTNDAEANVENMGFYRADVVQKGRDQYEYYWNADDKFCLAMVSHLGLIDRVFKGTRVDCNQKPDAGGALAVGAVAAAILGSALLTSKSNDREKHVDNNNANHVAAFDRGYRDGLHNQSYHNVYRDVDERNAYGKGYSEGSQQRGHNTAHHTGHTDYIGHAYVGDLYGKNTAYGERQLTGRGFQKMNSKTNNWGTHQYWYNYDTHQCLDVSISNGRYEQVRSAQAYECQEHQRSYNQSQTTKAYKEKYNTNDYDAIGNIRCEVNGNWQNCEFGVQRHGYNRADVYVTLPNGSERVFNFNGNRVGTPGGGMSISKPGDEWVLGVGAQTFTIPEAVINGG